MKTNWIISRITGIIVLLIFIGTSVGFSILYFQEVATSRRRLDNIQALTSEVEQFKTRDNRPATKAKAQNPTNMELRTAFPEVTQQLKNLYIPTRLAESYTQASTAMSAEISAPVRDTTIYRKNTDARSFDKLFRSADSSFSSPPVPEPVEAKTFSYSDQWISLSGYLDPDTAKIKVAAVDTIFTAIYRGQRRHPWAWILSKRKLEVAATNRSPYINATVIQAGIIKH